MFFITEEEELLGKTIVFTHMAQFADYITIVTGDGGVLVIDVESDSDGKCNSIFPEHLAKRYLFDHSWLRKELNSKGIVTDHDISEYERIKKEEADRYRERMLKIKEDNERKKYNELKLKYENE
ncbi:hypothetical protein EBB07_28630 [Paenibacillaceae bacterium]|nr:hypothetical protein EBB07_28630 [Paenibacillaceae bacterium]